MIRKLLVLAALAVLLSCRPARRVMHPETPPGRWYVVARGETLESLAAREQVPAEDLLEVNGLQRAADVTPGRLIYLLGPGVRSAPPPGRAGDGTAGGGTAPGSLPVPVLAVRGVRLQWPLASAQLGSGFGARGGRPHEGIDLLAPRGTPVVAAGTGVVVYAGDGIRGYGNLVVLQHDGDLLTVYAHNAVLLVKEGQRVDAGQQVAEVGDTGRATAPHLHFEVREGQLPRDPLLFLPPRS